MIGHLAEGGCLTPDVIGSVGPCQPFSVWFHAPFQYFKMNILFSFVTGSKGVLAVLNVIAACKRLTSLSLKGTSLDFQAVQEIGAFMEKP